MPTAETLFPVLTHETRRRLLMLLQTAGELCVCELFQALDQGQAPVSRHLAILRKAGLVEARRHGTWIYYRLPAHLPPWIQTLFAALAEAPGNDVFAADAQRLRRVGAQSLACGPSARSITRS